MLMYNVQYSYVKTREGEEATHLEELHSARSARRTRAEPFLHGQSARIAHSGTCTCGWILLRVCNLNECSQVVEVGNGDWISVATPSGEKKVFLSSIRAPKYTDMLLQYIYALRVYYCIQYSVLTLWYVCAAIGSRIVVLQRRTRRFECAPLRVRCSTCPACSRRARCCARRCLDARWTSRSTTCWPSPTRTTCPSGSAALSCSATRASPFRLHSLFFIHFVL